MDIASHREVKDNDSWSMLNQRNYSYIQLSQLILCNAMLVISQIASHRNVRNNE